MMPVHLAGPVAYRAGEVDIDTHGPKGNPGFWSPSSRPARIGTQWAATPPPAACRAC
ncbi:hypothetical protein FAIPA1_90097 [Frankia sp. AiPs1]